MERTASYRLVIPCLLALGFALTTSSAFSQGITDNSGYITSGNWLVLGPFEQPNGCGGGGEGGLVQNYIAPTQIQCEYPEIGDLIDFDPAVAVSTAYAGPPGPDNGPHWRVFDDGTNDCDIDLLADTGALVTVDVMSFLITYVEYLGDDPIIVEICGNADDSIQVWLDGDLVMNRSICRGRGGCAGGACDDIVEVTIEPGIHRIALGVWQGGGDWGGSLRLQEFGVPILDDAFTHPDWVFRGVDPGSLLPDCIELPVRTASSPTDLSSCPPVGGGPVSVTITQVGGDSGETVTVTETIRGAVTPDMVTASNGGTVTALPRDPLAPVGVFDDHRNVVVEPECSPSNGDTFEAGGLYTMTNYGVDIWTNGDTFQFAYSKVRGDFDVTAHVASRTPAAGGRWGKHGIMAREDLSTRSRYSHTQDAVGDVTTAVHNNDDSTRMANRPTHGGSDNNEITPFTTNPSGDGIDDYCDGVGPNDGDCSVVHHDYMRLERIGTVFNSYSRASPADPWTLLGSLDWGASASDEVLVGLAVCSHLNSCDSPIQIEFDEFDFGAADIVPLTEPPPVGVQIVWEVQRSVLQGAGVSYEIDLDEGRVEFLGSVETLPVSGSPSIVVSPPIEYFGPIADPAFDYAHAIGGDCLGHDVTNPAPGDIAISGGGVDIWQGGDQFVFAYNEVSGDFSARVRVADRQFAPASRWGKHGIMARQDCSERSRYAFIHDQGEDLQDTTRMAVRPTHGGADNYEITPPVGGLHAEQLRLDRSGDEFIAYVFDVDGAFGGIAGEWYEVGRAFWGEDAPESVQLGLAVTSHQNCDITTITFTDWEVLTGPPPAPVQNLSCTLSAQGDADLTWDNPAGADTGEPISVQVGITEVLSLPGTATSATVSSGDLAANGFTTLRVVNSSGIPAPCTVPSGYSGEGFIKDWLFLGPLAQPGGANPVIAEIQRDYLTDGAGIDELNVEPREGDTVDTDFNGAAASTGLVDAPNRPDLNPGGVPTWTLHQDADDTIDFNDFYGSDLSDLMMYGVVYVEVEEDIVTDIGLASDDSIQVLLDGTEIFVTTVSRGYGVANEVQDVISSATTPQLNPLAAGTHKLMIKVFEGTGGNGFRLRFQDSTGLPQRVGSISVGPGDTGEPQFARGDADANSGAPNITDGIYVLNFLFLGGPPPPCMAAADGDDNGSVNITDGIYLLNFLFLGGPPPPAPQAPTCGSDPTADALTCESFPPCE